MKVKEFAYGIGGYWKVGEKHVAEISYHEPLGPGDTHYCDVALDTGEMIRVFDLKWVKFAN